MDEIINEKLAKLVCYILETGVWRYQFFWTRCDVVSTFTYKFKIKPRKVISYINNALTKLIGKEFVVVQNNLKEKIKDNDSFNDLLYRPATTNNYETRNRKIVGGYDKVFNRAFREHYHMTRGDMNRRHYMIIREYYNKNHEWLDYDKVKQDYPINGYKRK